VGQLRWIQAAPLNGDDRFHGDVGLAVAWLIVLAGSLDPLEVSLLKSRLLLAGLESR